MNKFFALCGLVLLVYSCSKDVTSEEVQMDSNLKRLISNVSPSGNYDYYILPDSKTDLASIPQDGRNPLTPEKVELGKMLFFETGIGVDALYAAGVGTFSCSSCHIPEAGFRPGSAQGVADGGEGFGLNGENRVKRRDYKEDELDVQSARPLSLINVAFVTNTFWNGQFGGGDVNEGTEDVWDRLEETELNRLGFEALETQNIVGMTAHRMSTNKELLDALGYTELYDAAFPEVRVSDRYETFVTSLALSAYLRSIISDQAPFQKWLKGDHEALTLQQKLGAEMFFGKARCTNCHYQQNLGSSEFHRLGVKDMYQRPSFNATKEDRRNLGRGGFTLREEDNYKFRVPQLYNLADAPFFFHGSSKHSLDEVITYKELAEAENPNIRTEDLSDKFNPLQLTTEEREALLTFISDGLRDPNLLRYKPDFVLSGNCFPNNDRQSKIDLGCY